MPSLTRFTRSIPRLLATLMVLGLLLTACSSDEVLDGEQPALAERTSPEQGIAEAGEAGLSAGFGLVDGDFAEIPLPTASQPVGEATVEDDVTVQSFMVTATSGTEVIEFYETELPPLGWVPGAETSSGTTGSGAADDLQSTWTKDGQTLLVSAAETSMQDTQLSLQLSGA